MTNLIVEFEGATYTLTDEPDGEPVLVAADGARYRAPEVVYIEERPPAGEDWFADMFGGPGGPISARDIASRGDLSAAPGETARAPAAHNPDYMDLTPYGEATLALYKQFMRQK